MHGSARLALALAVVAVGMCLGSGAAWASFSGKPSVSDLHATCVKSGKDRGTVFVSVAVRYPDAAKRKGFRRHDVRSVLKVRNERGMLVATDTDRGRAQVDIPGAKAYTHTHLHRLGRAASRRALGGGACTARNAAQIQVRAQVTQSLARGGAARASAAAPSQTAAAAATTIVQPSASAPVGLNGCVEDSLGLLDCPGAYLRNVSFTDRAVPYANFSFADLTGADFTEVRMGHVTMNKTILDGAKMVRALLGSASLTSASLNGTNLEGAAAPYANFAVATLTNTNLKGANFSGVNLINVKFEGTNTCDAESIIPHIFGFVCANGVVGKS